MDEQTAEMMDLRSDYCSVLKLVAKRVAQKVNRSVVYLAYKSAARWAATKVASMALHWADLLVVTMVVN